MTRSIAISERVRVPVLSVQITEAEPRVSTDDSFLTMADRLAMRWTPIASTSDRIAALEAEVAQLRAALERVCAELGLSPFGQ